MKLKSHRQTMLKLNSRVHSWVTRQENEFKSQQQQQLQLAPTSTGSAVAVGVDNNDGQSAVERATVDQLKADAGAEDRPLDSSSVSVGIVMDQCALDRELQLRLKDDVSDLYGSWDEAEAR